MTEKLTEDDIRLVENLNLLRLDNIAYNATFAVGLFYSFFVIPFIPYTGWKKRPETPPKDMDEYFTRLIPFMIIGLLAVVPPIINWIIKKIELRDGPKNIVEGKVLLKTKLVFKRKLIIFIPFNIIIYRRTYHFMELSTGDRVKMQLTSLGRLFKYKRID
ncbi:MAG: hypothetical protein KA713_01325 [Chryseotalea sp. WA131a]|nr:MAG: hypothetical protein KA713_01325 [Chryseotalea sp. WA131a]